MNILFVLYGDFGSNSAHPMALHARELHARGHRCTAAVPQNVDGARDLAHRDFRPVLYEQVLADPASVFEDGRPADIVHAWTPREYIRTFVTAYQAKQPTPWILYHEDNEDWIAKAALELAGFRVDALLQHTDAVISTWTPPGMPHPLRFRRFIGLADAAVVIQDKLCMDVPPWLPCATVMPGVDLALFAPRPPDAALRSRYGVKDAERVIVYPGGLNGFTRPGLEALCRTVGIVNARGTPCRLLRCGPVPLDFLDALPPEAAAAVTDLGTVPRADLAPLLALADVLVQPGKPDPFEDLRLPGKLPELLATGRPVVLPDTNIAHLLRDGVDAVLHRTGTPEEMAEKCLELFADPGRARAIGEAGRRFAESRFDPRVQAGRLEAVYEDARKAFDPHAARELWSGVTADTPVDEVLARKLRALANRGGSDARMLEAYAALLDEARARSEGLHIGIGVRDRDLEALRKAGQALQREYEALGTHAHELRLASEAAGARAAALEAAIAERDAHLAAMRSSLSWRLMAPLRAAWGLLARRDR